LVAGRQNHRLLGASHHRRRQRRIPLLSRGRQRYRANVIRRTGQLSLPGLVARWQISNLPLGRRREDGFALDTASPQQSCSRLRRNRISKLIEFLLTAAGSPTFPTNPDNPRFT
jgi:hypothetical protein